MTALANALTKRINEATDEMESALQSGNFAMRLFNQELKEELQTLLDRSAANVETIELDKPDAQHLADFIEANEQKFVEFLVSRRVSLAGRHSLNLMNQLRDHEG